MLEVAIKNKQTKQNLISRAKFIFKLGEKPMDGNVFGNKTRHSRHVKQF